MFLERGDHMLWGLLTGFAFGLIAALIGFLKLKVGALKVYIPNELDESPYLYTELNKTIHEIMDRKYVLFKVETQHLHTQE